MHCCVYALAQRLHNGAAAAVVLRLQAGCSTQNLFYALLARRHSTLASEAMVGVISEKGLLATKLLLCM
jgi:hypothetical protein